MKPDALSHQYLASDDGEREVSIISSSCVVGALTWAVTVEVLEVHKVELDPKISPKDKMCVPSAIKARVLERVHMNKLPCHLGTNCMLSLIKRHLWWSTMSQDVKEYVVAC